MTESLHQIKLRHRLEWNQFQSTVSTAKGKGAKQQIRQHEQLLLDRHKDEIKQYHASKQSIDINTTNAAVDTPLAEQFVSMSLYSTNNDIKPQLSAKQLKKQRKQQQQAERLQQIKSEVSNMADQRDVELQELNAQLQSIQCSIKSITADGNCMYSAVCDQLCYIHSNKQSKLYTQLELRELAAGYIQSHTDQFINYIHSDDGNDDITIDEYCSRLVDTNDIQWGTHTELVALSNALHLPITVYTAYNKPLCITPLNQSEPINSNNVIKLSYHQHYYTLGQHYNSVVPQASSDNDDGSYQHVEHNDSE